MEVALENEMPNYAGGLGVLAADTLMSAADMGEPVVGVTLLYHQDEDPEYAFNASRYLTRRPETLEVSIEDRQVKIAIWEKQIIGRSGQSVPVFFLSADLPDNKPWDRDLTRHLYAPERYFRLGQEAILGIGGVRALQALGYDVSTYHLNEGHAALAALELLRTQAYDESAVRRRVTFTTHTPIPAGHDYFTYDLAYQVLRDFLPHNVRELAGSDMLGMTQLAMRLSKSTNSVAKRHQKVCEDMFPGHAIKNVTNGIYAPRWAGEHMAALFDAHLHGWDEDPSLFAHAPERLPDYELALARQKQEDELLAWINRNENYFAVSNVADDDKLETEALTIGFARRTVPYKRPDLIFRDIERLERIGTRKIQLIFASRCHAGDSYCNALRERLAVHAERLRGKVRIVLIPDYDLAVAKRLVGGCDVWLNNPVPPQEASGTSGMKAALNGSLNLSLNDGWWIEAQEREPESGWGFGGDVLASAEEQDAHDASLLYGALEKAVECYYDHGDEWLRRMKRSISLLSYFNTTRLVHEYRETIWDA